MPREQAYRQYRWWSCFPTSSHHQHHSQFRRVIWSEGKQTIDVSAGGVFWPNVLIQVGSNLARWQESCRCSCGLIFLTLPLHLFYRFRIVVWLGGRPGGHSAAVPSMSLRVGVSDLIPHLFYLTRRAFWLGAGPGAQCRRTVDVATRGGLRPRPSTFFIDTAELFGPGASVLCEQQLQARFSALILLPVLLISQRSLTRKRNVDMAASRDFRLFSIDQFGAVCPGASVEYVEQQLQVRDSPFPYTCYSNP